MTNLIESILIPVCITIISYYLIKIIDHWIKKLRSSSSPRDDLEAPVSLALPEENTIESSFEGSLTWENQSIISARVAVKSRVPSPNTESEETVQNECV